MAARIPPRAQVWIGIGLYTLAFAAIGHWKVWLSNHSSADLATFCQSFYYTVSLGRPLDNSLEPGGHFAVHVSPLLLLLTPAYALFPSELTLQVLQALATALGALPLYGLASRHLGEGAGRTLAVAYLLYHPLHGATFEMFNENSFVVAPLLAAIEALDRSAWRAFWFWCAVTVLFREDAAVLLAALGLYVAVVRRQPRPGLILGASSLGWLLLCFLVVMPHFNTRTDNFEGTFFKVLYGHLGATPIQALARLFTDPLYVLRYVATAPNLGYFLEMLFPLAFLPLGDLPLFAVTLPVWVMNLLSDYGAQHMATSHYSTVMVPILFWATVRVLKPRPSWLRVVLVLTLMGTLFLDPSPLRVPFRFTAASPHVLLRQAVCRSLPADLSVACTPELAIYLYRREHLYVRPLAGTDVIVVEPEVQRFRTEGWAALIQDCQASPEYARVFERDGIVAYARRGVDLHLPPP